MSKQREWKVHSVALDISLENQWRKKKLRPRRGFKLIKAIEQDNTSKSLEMGMSKNDLDLAAQRFVDMAKKQDKDLSPHKYFKAGANSMRDSIVEWLRSEVIRIDESLQCSDDYAEEIEKRFK